MQLITRTWGLTSPSALISIIGSRDSSFDRECRQVFAGPGLKRAAETTNAWILTDGTYEGIGGMVGGLMGGLGGGGAAGLIGLLGQSGISGGTAAKFLPLFLNLIKGQAGNALFGKILGAVPMLKEAAGGEGGQGALAGLLS